MKDESDLPMGDFLGPSAIFENQMRQARAISALPTDKLNDLGLAMQKTAFPANVEEETEKYRLHDELRGVIEELQANGGFEQMLSDADVTPEQFTDSCEKVDQLDSKLVYCYSDFLIDDDFAKFKSDILQMVEEAKPALNIYGEYFRNLYFRAVTDGPAVDQARARLASGEKGVLHPGALRLVDVSPLN